MINHSVPMEISTNGQHSVAIILATEWDGITPIHSSTHSTQDNQLKHAMAKENHMRMLQYCPKTGDIATFQPICSFNSWAEPKCYLRHH